MSKSAFKSTNADQLRAWLDEAMERQMTWHKINSPNLKASDQAIYEAGFRLGWLQAVGAAQMHKLFKE